MTMRTSADIAVDIADCRAARSALLKGERVEDVWRDGSRMRLTKVSLTDLNTAIDDLNREHADAIAAETGSGGASAIGVRYG